jgi:[ribosomal protein S5]-alanine N-acetyltransferase
VEIAINEELYMRPFRHGDEDALVEMLNHENTYNNTLRVPYPYTVKDATGRLDSEKAANREIPVWYAICLKKEDGKPIGSISVMPEVNPMRPHLAEVGYCMHPGYQNRGYTTHSVKTFSEFVFRTFPFDKLIAYSFVWNTASEKVLSKAGYKEEGLLRHHYKKNGNFIDSKAFGLLKEEILNG